MGIPSVILTMRTSWNAEIDDTEAYFMEALLAQSARSLVPRMLAPSIFPATPKMHAKDAPRNRSRAAGRTQEERGRRRSPPWRRQQKPAVAERGLSPASVDEPLDTAVADVYFYDLPTPPTPPRKRGASQSAQPIGGRSRRPAEARARRSPSAEVTRRVVGHGVDADGRQWRKIVKRRRVLVKEEEPANVLVKKEEEEDEVKGEAADEEEDEDKEEEAADDCDWEGGPRDNQLSAEDADEEEDNEEKLTSSEKDQPPKKKTAVAAKSEAFAATW